MFDIIIRRASLPDGREPVDIAIKGDRVAEITADIMGEAREEIDATGRLVSPPFVDPHFHMDATLSLGSPRMNVSGTLLEGIALWGELKPLLTPEAVIERATRILRSGRVAGIAGHPFACGCFFNSVGGCRSFAGSAQAGCPLY